MVMGRCPPHPPQSPPSPPLPDYPLHTAMNPFGCNNSEICLMWCARKSSLMGGAHALWSQMTVLCFLCRVELGTLSSFESRVMAVTADSIREKSNMNQ